MHANFHALCSMPAVFTKMALDQLLMAPLFLVVFFFATKTLEGLPHKLPGLQSPSHLKVPLSACMQVGCFSGSAALADEYKGCTCPLTLPCAACLEDSTCL